MPFQERQEKKQDASLHQATCKSDSPERMAHVSDDGRGADRNRAVDSPSFPGKVDPRGSMTMDLGKGVTLDLLWIRAGSFERREPAHSFEPGIHIIEVGGFWIGRTPVTQEQYKRVVGRNPSRFPGPLRPVENVSWHDAMRFCSRASDISGMPVALPSESQWEYACRAGSDATWCYGNDGNVFGEYAWYGSNSDQKTHRVGQKKPNNWGLYDIHGNVWEWCIWEDRGDGSRHNGNPSYGKFVPNLQALRGGSWGDDPYSCRSAARGGDAADGGHERFGFRVVSLPSDLH